VLLFSCEVLGGLSVWLGSLDDGDCCPGAIVPVLALPVLSPAEPVLESGIAALPVVPSLAGGGGVESIALGLLSEVAGAGGVTFSFLLQPLSIRPAMATMNKLRCIISVPSVYGWGRMEGVARHQQ
jgi:hypothetical protein